eukprot:COSAG03_NODE_1634_length_3739_cov_17.806868_5_plen_267_part_00
MCILHIYWTEQVTIGARIPEKYQLLQEDANRAGESLASRATLSGMERLDQLQISHSPAVVRRKPTAQQQSLSREEEEVGRRATANAAEPQALAPQSYWPPTTEAAASAIQEFQMQTDKFKKAVTIARTSATMCRGALRLHSTATTAALAGAGSGSDHSSEEARAELFLALLTAAEVTAYGLVSMQEAVDGSVHASVRSALNAKQKTMGDDMRAVESALASVEADARTVLRTPQRSRTSTASTDWDDMSTPRQVEAFAGVLLPSTPR